MRQQKIRILIGTDGSDGAARALDVASEFAHHLDADLHIIHVLAADNFADERALRELARQEHTAVGDLQTAFYDQLVAKASERAKSFGVAIVHTHYPRGDPAQIIIEFALTHRVDTIVVGRRGRGRLAGLLLGSVSQKLTALAPCNVLVVP